MKVAAPTRSRGLTLLELLIVLAVLVLMIGIGIAGFDRLGGVRLRTETNRLAAAIRYTFNRASAHGLYMRMVFDLDGESYSVQASADPMFLREKPAEDGEDPDDPDAAEREKDKTGWDGDEKPKNVVRARYQEDGVIPTVKMEGGTGVDGVFIAGQKEPLRTGKAYLHFFPNGFVEPAVIHTTDGEGTYYTLTIHPLTGRVERKPGREDPERSFGEPEKTEQEGR